ncbi:hypothetical protein T06_10847 [Trichinella sp. T6]|nr:hypothetical protein T06_10847 [Trichinella sp. T6]
MSDNSDLLLISNHCSKTSLVFEARAYKLKHRQTEEISGMFQIPSMDQTECSDKTDKFSSVQNIKMELYTLLYNKKTAIRLRHSPLGVESPAAGELAEVSEIFAPVSCTSPCRGAMYTNLNVTDAISKKDHLETFADINSIALNIRKLTIEEKPKFDK